MRSMPLCMKVFCVFWFGLAGLLVHPSAALATPYFLIDSETEWTANLGAHINPVEKTEWDEYMLQWNQHLREGDPYPSTAFLSATLYVYPGDPDLGDAGLVMTWGGGGGGGIQLPAGNYASAWKYDYGLDPDLSNVTIKVTVTPPSASKISVISFAIQHTDALGNIFTRSWWWRVGLPPAIILYDTPTTITINTAFTGVGAANPAATGYMNKPGFDITKAQFFLADENAAWVGGPLPVPPIGGPAQGLWNYWHNLVVIPNSPVKPLITKWSQPPVEIEPGSRVFNGWDELSRYIQFPIVADDWLCEDDRPVTDIHWWGSFIGWRQPYLPPIIPIGFHIGIWTDVPVSGETPSHPGMMIWENTCTTFTWNFAGYDNDPRNQTKYEACFQFNQDLPMPDWFYQEPGPTVYWLSIAAIYKSGVTPEFPWGWKTRPHFYNDDAVRILSANPWPPVNGSSTWVDGEPIEYPEGISWDLAFELTTRELDFGDAPDPSYPTLRTSNGARHLLDGLTYLGASVDAETDGQPDAAATGDDGNGNDDEDGVTFPASLICGTTVGLNVTASQTGLLNAWLDFNRDGDWADTGEQIFTDQALSGGLNSLTVSIPATALLGSTYARFRFSSQSGLAYTGQAPDGEVEDYQVTITANSYLLWTK